MAAPQVSADRLGFPFLLTESGVPFASMTKAVADHLLAVT